MDEMRQTQHGPMQFSIGHLLLFTAGFAALLGFFIVCYPFSAAALPVLLLSVLVGLGVAIASKRKRPAIKGLFIGVLIYVVFTILIIGSGASVGIVWPYRLCCVNNLKQIVLALHNYHDRYGSFPPAYVADGNGRPIHSWRVLLLPYLGEQALYNSYRFDEPWDSPSNRQLLNACPNVFHCPADESARNSPMTSYVAVVGSETAWPRAVGRKMGEFSDGTANTIMVVEIANSGICWTEPRDLDFSKMPMSVNPEKAKGMSSLHRENTWWQPLVGAYVAFADGTVELLPTNTPPESVRALLTIAGGEADEPKP